jgi:DNA polymerase V
MWKRRADIRAHGPLQLFINQRVRVPLVLCRVPAGFPSPADDYVERTIDLNEWLIGNQVATFIVRAEGDSMTGEIHSGDRLIVDRSLEARHRDVVVACLDGEMIVKRLLVQNGRYYLQPENTSYPLIEITEERELIIWGVVTHSIHPLR